MSAVSYYIERADAPTLPRIIIYLTPILNTLFCLKKGLFSGLIKNIAKEFK